MNASLVGANKVNGPVPSRAGRSPASLTRLYRMLKSVSSDKMSAIVLVSGVGGAGVGGISVGGALVGGTGVGSFIGDSEGDSLGNSLGDALGFGLG
jgi:hypothetical protein